MARYLPIFCILALLIPHLQMQAQNVAGNEQTPSISKYKISITIDGTPETTLYLKGYEGETSVIVDSAKVRKNTAIFKSKQSLPCGVYSIINNRDSLLLDIILNKDAKFSVSTTIDNLQTDRTYNGSEENSILFAFQKRLSQLPAGASDAANNLLHEYTETAPEAFVSKYINARYGNLCCHHHQDMQLIADEHVTELIQHTDFSEPRLLHSPLPIYNVMCHYLADQGIYNTDSLQAVVTNVMERCTDVNVRNFYLSYFFHIFDQHNPDYDPILVYLYDNFDRSWISEEFAPWYKRKVDRIRKILPGAKLPRVYSHDIDGTLHAVQDFKSKYTVLWFWDPDCDHCLTETPRLHELFEEYGDTYDFQVFAVEVNGDYDRWKEFSDEHKLWDWTNLTVAKGEPSHDFFDYFDIMTTPVMFLVDNSKNNTIIARQWTLDELMMYFNKINK